MSEKSLKKIRDIYSNIPESRFSFVENIALSFREKYCEENIVDWERAADAEDIIYIEDARAIIPFISYHTRSVVVHPFTRFHSKDYSNTSRAHEFGHILLEHKKIKSSFQCEDEAEYFSYSVLGTNIRIEGGKISGNLSMLSNLFMHPFATAKNVLFQWDYRDSILFDHLGE